MVTTQLQTPDQDVPFSRFFTPTAAFWDWLAEKAKGRTVVDIGCGRGDLVLECEARGITAVGIDPCFTLFDVPVPPELAAHLIPFEVIDCKDLLEADDVLLLCCRPCHNGFPIDVAEARRRSPFYYIGFEKNLDRDLGGTECRADSGDVGEDGERIFEVAMD